MHNLPIAFFKTQVQKNTWPHSHLQAIQQQPTARADAPALSNIWNGIRKLLGRRGILPLRVRSTTCCVSSRVIEDPPLRCTKLSQESFEIHRNHRGRGGVSLVWTKIMSYCCIEVIFAVSYDHRLGREAASRPLDRRVPSTFTYAEAVRMITWSNRLEKVCEIRTSSKGGSQPR